MGNELAKEIYCWAVTESGIDWRGKSLLFLAVKFVEHKAREGVALGDLVNDSHIIDMEFGEAWSMLLKSGRAGGVKC